MAVEEQRLAQRSLAVGIKRRKKMLSDCVEARPDLLEPVIMHYRSLMGAGALTAPAVPGAEPSGGGATVTPPSAPRRA
eukprot:6467010-Amphidinium_carterae.2